MNIGDHMEAGLSAVGITAERVSRLLGRPCKCKERQRRLNELGQAAAAAIRMATGQEATSAEREMTINVLQPDSHQPRNSAS